MIKSKNWSRVPVTDYGKIRCRFGTGTGTGTYKIGTGTGTSGAD